MVPHVCINREIHDVKEWDLAQYVCVSRANLVIDFRMRYSQTAWEKERDGWRSVVQLNVVRSITTILGVVDAEMNGEVLDSEDDEEAPAGEPHETVKFSDKHQMLMIRLAPLRAVEAELKRRLGAGTEPIQPSLPMTATPFDDPADNLGLRRTAPEFSVRSWKEVLDPVDRFPQIHSTGGDLDSPTLTIAGCKDDMKALWDDKMVRLALKRRKLRLPDSAGLWVHPFLNLVVCSCHFSFLNDLERIATRGYTVSDNDIVRARLRTVGIQEHRLKFQHGPWDNPKRVCLSFPLCERFLTDAVWKSG